MRDVVDLGLAYGLNVEQGDEGKVALLDMTLTSAACPLTDVIEDPSRSALIGSGLVNDQRINWVWSPPLGPDKITEDARTAARPSASPSELRPRSSSLVTHAAKGGRGGGREGGSDGGDRRPSVGTVGG
jgi:metal-sulfur cluster biosynthetic enzyme